MNSVTVGVHHINTQLSGNYYFPIRKNIYYFFDLTLQTVNRSAGIMPLDSLMKVIYPLHEFTHCWCPSHQYRLSGNYYFPLRENIYYFFNLTLQTVNRSAGIMPLDSLMKVICPLHEFSHFWCPSHQYRLSGNY